VIWVFCFNATVPKRSTPPLVTVICVLLFIAGGVILFNAVLGYSSAGSAILDALPLWGQATYALLNIGIGVALYRRMPAGWPGVVLGTADQAERPGLVPSRPATSAGNSGGGLIPAAQRASARARSLLGSQALLSSGLIPPLVPSADRAPEPSWQLPVTKRLPTLICRDE
jgi:hypothetical protein